MSSFYPPKMQPRPTPAALAADAVCHNCRGSLQGLAIDAHCKCGAPVSVSMHGDLVRYSNPKWIDRVRLGLLLAFIGFILGGLGAAGYYCCKSWVLFDPLIPATVCLVAAMMELVGTWFFTKPDPSGLGEKRYGKVRKFVRAWMLLSLLFIAAFSAEYLKFGLKHIASMAGVVPLALRLIILINPVVQLIYLSRFANRIPDTMLNERARFLSRAVAISSGIYLGSILCIAIEYRLPDYFDDSDIDCTGFALMAGEAALGIFLIMTVLLLGKFTRRLKEQARLARQVWV